LGCCFILFLLEEDSEATAFKGSPKEKRLRVCKEKEIIIGDAERIVSRKSKARDTTMYIRRTRKKVVL